jgi:hypothetical protein
VSRSRRSRPRPVDAAILALAGATAIAASMTFRGTAVPETSGTPVPVDAGARNPGDIKANNSPTLAQNPKRPANLAVVNRVDSPRYTCGLHVSQDHGAHWNTSPLPIPRGEEPKCFGPDLAFAADGTLYISYVTLQGTTNEPHAVWLVRSTDGGRTLSAPRRVAGPLGFQVRVATDPTRPKRVYVTWLAPDMVGLYLFSGADNRIVVASSGDGGRSFGRPVRVSPRNRQRVLSPSAVVAPDGALYVLYLDLGGDRLDYEGGHGSAGGAPYRGRFALVLGRSTDGGTTWQESLVDDRVVPTRRFIAFLPPSPSLAVDPGSGRIYVAFEDGRHMPSDVYVWSLGKDAGTWSGPAQVNDTTTGDRSWQYLPKIAVAPDGRLDVVYYDRRKDPSGLQNHVSAQSSSDAGETFTPHATLTDRSFDSRIGAGSERNLPDLGSRLGLVSEGSALLAAWTDTRAGTVSSNKQDIAFAQATITRSGGLSSSARSGLRFGAIALLLAAFALLILPRLRSD